jgi:Cu-processing system ATP-binding protein
MLDEPTAGLDPIAASTFKDLVFQEREQGKTILLTSHILSEVQELADRIVFLLEGKCIFEGESAELLDSTGERTLERAISRLLNSNRAERTNPQFTQKGLHSNAHESVYSSGVMRPLQSIHLEKI